MISHHLKESPEDAAVKAALWCSTQRELLRFAARYRSEHIVGNRSCSKQEEVCAAASREGYPVTLVRFLGAQKRKHELDEAAQHRLDAWQRKIGLRSSGAQE